MSGGSVLRVINELYGGRAQTEDPAVALPFVLRGETVRVDDAGQRVSLIEPAPERVTPRCPHFGACGGCQYQMIEARQQMDVKRRILRDLLYGAGIEFPGEIDARRAEEYGYRNRIRLRVERAGGELRLGYNVRGTTTFLPIRTCPIATPVLWSTAETWLRGAADDADAAFWMNAASEVELFCDDALTKMQMVLYCAPRTKAKQGSWERFFAALQRAMPQVVGAGAMASDPRTGPTGRVLGAAGAAGLSYRVLDETYWVSRGGFFQVNRFLIGDLVKLVCEHEGAPRSGEVAWDLFAGVGLFSRVLARSFARVVAVEANAGAAADNRIALRRLSPAHDAVAKTTLAFLQEAVVQRERPELVVLDPPRAGAGAEACELLLRIGAAQMVYVSCDPETLSRDLAVLASEYEVKSVTLVDLFPQTFHMETVVVLERRK